MRSPKGVVESFKGANDGLIGGSSRRVNQFKSPNKKPVVLVQESEFLRSRGSHAYK